MTREELLTNFKVEDIINNPILRDFIAGELEIMEGTYDRE